MPSHDPVAVRRGRGLWHGHGRDAVAGQYRRARASHGDHRCRHAGGRLPHHRPPAQIQVLEKGACGGPLLRGWTVMGMWMKGLRHADERSWALAERQECRPMLRKLAATQTVLPGPSIIIPLLVCRKKSKSARFAQPDVWHVAPPISKLRMTAGATLSSAVMLWSDVVSTTSVADLDMT